MRKLIMAIMIMAAPVMAFADAPVGGGGAKGKCSMHEHGDSIQKLNLTPEQLSAIHDIRNAVRRKHVELRAKLELKQMDFQSELKKDKPDQKTLATLIDEITALRAQKGKDKLEMKVKIMSLLTPEQKRAMPEQMGKACQKHSQHREI